MAKRRKLTKRLRKGMRRVLGNHMVQDVLDDLISAALIAAAIKLRDSAALQRAAEVAKAKSVDIVEAAERAVGSPGSRKRKLKRR